MSIKKEEMLKVLKSHPEYQDEYTDTISSNIDDLLIPVNKIRELWSKPLTVTSGWRPVAYNKSIGGAKNSLHCLGMAVDFKDSDGSFAAFCVELDKQGKLKELGLWMEHPDSTKGWVHLDHKDRGDRKTNIFKP